MKKLLSVLFAGALLLAMAGPASANHRVWAGTEPNYVFEVGGQLEIDGWLKNKLPSFADETLAYWNQESRIVFKGTWGDVEGQIRLEYDYDWTTGNQNKGSTDQNALDQAWIKFPLPGTPVMLKAGLQPIVFGKSILIDTDQYSLLATIPIDKMAFTLGTIKWIETHTAQDDKDAYFGIFSTSAIPNNTLAAILYYQIDQAVDENGIFDLGAVLDGGAAGLKYWVEGHYEFGKVNEDVDLSAFFIGGAVSANVGMADVSLIALAASGDNDNTDDTFKAFVPIKGNFGEDTFMVIYQLTGGNLSDLWAVALRGDVKPMANLTLSGLVSFWNGMTDARVEDEKYLGTEFDVLATYNINAYMNWVVRAGYLISGDGLVADYDENPLVLNNEWKVLF